MNYRKLLCCLILVIFGQTVFAAPVSLHSIISKRRSVRSFQNKNLSLQQVKDLLWAGQGVTDHRRGLRAAPSAGALYPLTLFVVKNDGIWQHLPEKNKLRLIRSGNNRLALLQATLGQQSVKEAPASIVITGDYKKTTKKYHRRGILYVHIEVGHVAQNILLQATSMGLGAVTLGGFDPDKVRKVLGVSYKEVPLYVIAVGYP